MEDIGREANLSPGLPYRYFSSKEDIIQTAFTESLSRLGVIEPAQDQADFSKYVEGAIRHAAAALTRARRALLRLPCGGWAIGDDLSRHGSIHAKWQPDAADPGCAAPASASRLPAAGLPAAVSNSQPAQHPFVL
jgi:AcrR family transcriptional regulator